MHTFRFKLRLFLPVESPHLMFQEPWEVKRFAAGCWLQWPPWKFLRGERVGGGTGRGCSEASGEEPCRISESQPGRRGNCGRDGGRPPLAGTPRTHVCVCVVSVCLCIRAYECVGTCVCIMCVCAWLQPLTLPRGGLSPGSLSSCRCSRDCEHGVLPCGLPMRGPGAAASAWLCLAAFPSSLLIQSACFLHHHSAALVVTLALC